MAFRGQKSLFRQSDALALQNDAEGQQNAHGLRESRAKCCACRAETKRPHEEEVQPDVHHAGRGDEVHGASGVAHPPENRRQYVIGCDAGDADEADGEVGRRAGHGLLRGGDEPDDGVHEAHQRRRQHYRAHHKEGDGVADDLRGLLFVACAHRPADADSGTHRHAHQYHSDHMHHLTADGDSGGACHPLEPADDEKVCHAVEGLQKVREQIGQREGEDVFQHAAAGEVFFHVFRSACPLPSPPRASGFAPELQAGFLSMLYNKALHCCKVKGQKKRRTVSCAALYRSISIVRKAEQPDKIAFHSPAEDLLDQARPPEGIKFRTRRPS